MDAYLQKMNIRTPKACKVPLVNWKIMSKFPKARSQARFLAEVVFGEIEGFHIRINILSTTDYPDEQDADHPKG